MDQKTQVFAPENTQEIIISRNFDLPVDLVFKAYTIPELIEQWMGNNVLKMENVPHGSYLFETRSKEGEILFRANGTIHNIEENQTIIRTFEMENAGFPPQLEFLEFIPQSLETSTLQIKMVFKSIQDRDKLLTLPFRFGLNMAHDRLEKIFQT